MILKPSVSYSQEGRGISHPPPTFQTKFISTCNNISATSLLWPRIYQGLNYKNFPQDQCTSHDWFFPLPKTPVWNPATYCSFYSVEQIDVILSNNLKSDSVYRNANNHYQKLCLIMCVHVFPYYRYNCHY